jgi:hypothetical protein
MSGGDEVLGRRCLNRWGYMVCERCTGMTGLRGWGVIIDYLTRSYQDSMGLLG